MLRHEELTRKGRSLTRKAPEHVPLAYSMAHHPACILYCLANRDAATHEVHVTGVVPLHLQRARLERPLLSDEDVEVLVGGVEAQVSLCTERRAKDDRVLRDARVRRANRAARVVEDPFRAVRVDRDARACVAVRLVVMCEVMPAVSLGDAASADDWSSCRWTGSKTYHRSWKRTLSVDAREKFVLF